MIIIDDRGVTSVRPFRPAERLQCVFEYVVLRAAGLDAVGAQRARRAQARWGTSSPREHPVEADLVIAVPDSGWGRRWAMRGGVRPSVRQGLDPQPLRGPHLHRAQPGHPALRRQGEAQPECARCWPASAWWSSTTRIVRGTTSRKIVRDDPPARARARCTCASPRRPSSGRATTGSTRRPAKELIGASHDVAEIQRYLGADTPGYLSLEGMLKATGNDPNHFCHACFTGAVQGRLRADGRLAARCLRLPERPAAWIRSPCRAAGVDIQAGDEAVRRIAGLAARTPAPGGAGGIRAFAAFRSIPPATASRCSSRPPTAWDRS